MQAVWEIPRLYCENDKDTVLVACHTSFAIEEHEVVSLKNSCKRKVFKVGFIKRRDHKYEVAMSQKQRHVLRQLISSGKATARKPAHARILLNIDRNTPGNKCIDELVARAIEVSRYTVIRIREPFVEHGLDDALNNRHTPQRRSRALNGEQEAHLIALICSPCTDGQARWTLRLLASRMLKLEHTERVSYEKVWRVLKMNSSRG